MADASIGIEETGAPTRLLDTEQLTVGVDVVDRERIQVAGAAADDIAVVVDTDPGATDHGVVVRDIGPAIHLRNDAFLAAGAVGGELDDTTPVVATEGNVSPVRITAQRAFHVNVRTDAGAEIGTAASPFRVDPTGTTAQPVTDDGGTLSIDDAGASITVDGTITIQDGGNVISVDDAGGSLTVDVGAIASGVAIEVRGDIAHDVSVGTSNPVLIAARANTNEPVAVAAGDVSHLWCDTLGRLVVTAGHPNPETPSTTNVTASGETQLIAGPGAGNSLFVQRVTVVNRDANPRVVALLAGSGGTIVARGEAAAEGGGFTFDFGAHGWEVGDDVALVGTLDATGNVDVNVSEYYIAAA